MGMMLLKKGSRRWLSIYGTAENNQQHCPGHRNGVNTKDKGCIIPVSTAIRVQSKLSRKGIKGYTGT